MEWPEELGNSKLRRPTTCGLGLNHERSGEASENLWQHRSCWDFSTTSVLEGAWFIATVNMSLSSELRHEVIVHGILFGVEHDECCVTLSTRSTTARRHEVFVHCILFGVEHDERYDSLIQILI